MRNISYPEAARLLARQYNVEIKEEEKTSEEIARDRERESVLLFSMLHRDGLKTISMASRRHTSHHV